VFIPDFVLVFRTSEITFILVALIWKARRQLDCRSYKRKILKHTVFSY